MRIAVTGATGFIGTHLVKELAASGHDVVGVDLRPPDEVTAAYLGPDGDRVRFATADLAVRGHLEDAAPGPFDGVVHAAVVTSTAEVEAADPERVVSVNLLGTIETLRVARVWRARRFIYVSSSGVYGETDPAIPLTEDAPLQLRSLYTMTKYASERLVASANGEDGLAGASIRIAAPYGPMERPTGARTVMSLIHGLVHAAVEGRPVRLAGGGHGRDWTYAGDVGRAVGWLLRAPRLAHACYNVSSGTIRTVAEVARTLALLVPGFAWRPAASSACDLDGGRGQRRGPLDLARIHALGFAPRYGLREGLEETVAWIRRVG